MYAGIDPGKTGAIAFVSDEGDLREVMDFGEAFPKLRLLLSQTRFVYLEEVHAMPKQGVSSTFTFGQNYGWWKGFLQALDVSFKTIRPQDWGKGLVPKKGTITDKPGLDVARQIYPDAPLHLKKHHNRADALLLARVCWQREKGVAAKGDEWDV